MSPEDRELLAELAAINSDVTPLAMRIMDGSVTSEEQLSFAQRLIAMGARLQARAAEPWRVVEGEVDEEAEQHRPDSGAATGTAAHRER